MGYVMSAYVVSSPAHNPHCSVQWGIAKEADHTTYEFPLAFSTKAFITVGTHVGTNTQNAMFIPHIDIKSRSSFVATFEQSPTTAWMYYIAIGY